MSKKKKTNKGNNPTGGASGSDITKPGSTAR